MCYIARRHPISVKAHFRDSLVLTYAFPAEALRPPLPPGLRLDEQDGCGFAAIALVQTERLRPAFLPALLGRAFFLAGLRIFVTHRDRSGRTRRGLHILRSATDSRLMRFFGNALTHYNYALADIEQVESADALEVRMTMRDGGGDLHVIAQRPAKPRCDADCQHMCLPDGSPFAHWRAARRFAGPLPWTFDYEPQTRSIIRIRGSRSAWDPQPVSIEVLRNTFLERPPFAGHPPVLASAFLVSDIDYQWSRGVREPVDAEAPPCDSPLPRRPRAAALPGM